MANKKASKKDIRQSAKRRARNIECRSALKTHIKKVRTSATAHEVEQTAENLKVAVGALDKAAQRGILHKNAVARRKSRIAKAAAALLKKELPAPVEKKMPKAKSGKGAPVKAEAAPKAEPAKAEAKPKAAAKKPAPKKKA